MQPKGSDVKNTTGRNQPGKDPPPYVSAPNVHAPVRRRSRCCPPLRDADLPRTPELGPLLAPAATRQAWWRAGKGRGCSAGLRRSRPAGGGREPRPRDSRRATPRRRGHAPRRQQRTRPAAAEEEEEEGGGSAGPAAAPRRGCESAGPVVGGRGAQRGRMSRSVLQPSQQKLAEKLTILNDRGVGMLTRLYNIKKVRGPRQGGGGRNRPGAIPAA